MYTRLKLREAEFFWQRVLSAPNGSEERCFYLSAFLSAIRSTTFVMQSEYKTHPEFEATYPALQQKLQGNSVFSQLRDARNVSLKQGHKLPRLVTRYRGNQSGDEVVVEADPIPHHENAIRRVSISMGERDEQWVPADMPEDQRLGIGLMNAFKTLKAVLQNNPRIDQALKLTEEGPEYTAEDLDSQIRNGLADIWEAERALSHAELQAQEASAREIQSVEHLLR